jgi:hypothetical protein
VAEASLATAFLSGILIALVIMHSMPPESETERALKRRSEAAPSANHLARPKETEDSR